MLTQHVTKGGIPRDWTIHNLSWLAQAHRRHADHKIAALNVIRADWHRRWAVLIEDLLETHRVNGH